MVTPAIGNRAASMVDVIVVPLDDSELSDRAIRISTTLATRVGARLVLMLSLVEPAAVEREMGLDKIAANVHGVDTSIVMIRDRPAAEAIELMALEAGSSAVCMTTHGRGALRSPMFGSVAEQWSA